MSESRGWRKVMLILLHADDAIIILSPMPWSMRSLFIRPPPRALHLSRPQRGGGHTPAFPLGSIRAQTPYSSVFSPRGQAHNDTAPFRDASVPEKYLPPSSSPPLIKHLLKKSLFSTSAAFLPSNIWQEFLPLQPTAENAYAMLIIKLNIGRMKHSAK